MADIRVLIEGSFKAQGGAMAGGAARGGGMSGGGGGGGGFFLPGGKPPNLARKAAQDEIKLSKDRQKQQDTFFDKLNSVFTQPLYDLMRVMGISFRSIAGLRLGARAGQKMEGGKGGKGGPTGGGGGFLGGGGGAGAAGTATMAAIAGALVIIAIVLKKIVDNSEVIQAALAMIDMVLGSIYDMILMGIFITADMLGVFNRMHLALKAAFEWVKGNIFPLITRIGESIAFVNDKLVEVKDEIIEMRDEFITKVELLNDKTKEFINILIGLKDVLVKGVEFLTVGYWTAMADMYLTVQGKVVEGIIGGFTTVMDITGITGAFDKGKKVFEFISGLNFDGIKGLAGKAFDGVKGLAGKAFSGLTGLAGLGYEKFTELFSIGVEPVQKFIDLFGLDFTGFTNLFSLDYSEAIEFIKKLTGNPLTGGSEGGGGAAGAGLFGVAGIVATNLW
jgi:hypothetical protein